VLFNRYNIALSRGLYQYFRPLLFLTNLSPLAPQRKLDIIAKVL
jgi:hypothetical protein